MRKLARWEREESGRQKGSANRDKSRRKVAAAYNEVARARRDYHHEQAVALVCENQVIHVEDLDIVGMVKNRRLARAISEAGWSQFVRIIAEKADRYGRTVQTVSRWLASSNNAARESPPFMAGSTSNAQGARRAPGSRLDSTP